MNISKKTKAALVEEIEKLERKNARLEKAMLKLKQAASEKRRVEEELRASQKLVETIIEATPT